MELDYRFKALEPLPSAVTRNRKTKDFLYWKSYKFPITIKEHGIVNNIDFQKTANDLIAVSSSTRIQIYNQVTTELVKSFSRFRDVVYGATFRKDGKLLAAGSADASVRLYDIAGRIPLRTFEGHTKAVRAVKFCNDLYRLYSAADDKTIRLWDIATEKSIAVYKGHEDYVRTAYTSPASQDHIATGSYDHSAKIWDLRTSQMALTVDHGHPVECVLIHPSGSMLLTAGSDRVKIWDILQGGKLVSTLSNHHKTITSMTFNHDYTRLLTAGLDKHVKIYDIATYEVVHSIDYPAPILCLASSKNDRTLAVGMTDKTLSLRQRRDVLQHEILEEKAREKEWDDVDNRKRKNKFDKVQQSDIVIPSAKIKNFETYDHFFRKFEFTKALDAAFRGRNIDELMGVFVELIRRNKLKSALAGRTDKGIKGLVKIIVKNLSNPAYSSILLDVCDVLMDCYAEDILLRTVDLQTAFITLRNVVKNEIRVQREMCNLLGSLEAVTQTSLPIN